MPKGGAPSAQPCYGSVERDIKIPYIVFKYVIPIFIIFYECH